MSRSWRGWSPTIRRRPRTIEETAAARSKCGSTEFARDIDLVKATPARRRRRAGARGRRRQLGATIRDVATAMRCRGRAVCSACARTTPTDASSLRLARDDRRLRACDRCWPAFPIFLVRRSATRARRRRGACCATTTSIWKPRSTNAPPTCARPTTRSSASPTSSATICARRWSTSWASRASWRNCAATSSSGSPSWPRAIGAGRRTMRPTAQSRRSKAPTSSSRKDFTEALGFIKSSIGKMDRLITRSST